MKLTLFGTEALEKKLEQKSQFDLKKVQEKQLRDIYKRGRQQYYRDGAVPSDGGTPYDTSELLQSLSYRGDEVGYLKEYAPHVEYGHRTRNGGFVPGQYYLKRNVDAQRETYKKDLQEELRK
ncbi:hypothetical protein ACWOAH_09965 [Vagococcus vulneris]|uniref:hypothetical protein n=1 Tax=Vagococcus vulneris TaxID=1977869 RepID=UPI001F0B8DEE|nr:hypothetical protein [Vagococcus vulneris]